ncbi:uncharacterized protein LOC126412451 isoform X1 [Schistocerca serialis cubense]|uniref:uncharacterized protein LOC126412451 isoform X1 n=1 Tax=Schistocerca serialis cubense TaxID=2023355 RepID=UPI00214EBC20|nr:uncharacterized protein LOC126412451 isoform X1 [Schistocerca serialis cubense]
MALRSGGPPRAVGQGWRFQCFLSRRFALHTQRDGPRDAAQLVRLLVEGGFYNHGLPLHDDQQTTAIAMLCLGTIVLATSIALLVASIKERPGPLLVFVAVNAVVGALHAAVLPLEVLALFSEGHPRDAWALLVVAVAGVVLDVYLLVVVYSFHQFLCERQRSGTV